MGFEPTTSSLRVKRTANCAILPYLNIERKPDVSHYKTKMPEKSITKIEFFTLFNLTISPQLLFWLWSVDILPVINDCRFNNRLMYI